MCHEIFLIYAFSRSYSKIFIKLMSMHYSINNFQIAKLKCGSYKKKWDTKLNGKHNGVIDFSFHGKIFKLHRHRKILYYRQSRV